MPIMFPYHPRLDLPAGCHRLWSIFIWILFLFFSTILVFDRVVYNLLALMLVGLAIATLYYYRPKLDNDIRFYALVLLANLFLALPNIWLGLDGMESLENPVRMLMMLPLIFAVTRFGLNSRLMVSASALGLVASGMIVAWQYHVMDLSRPGGHYNPLLFSEVAMSAAALLLAACFVSKGKIVVLCLIGILVSLYAVVLSGSRGSLLALLPMVAMLLWCWWRRWIFKDQSPKIILLVLLILTLSLGAMTMSSGQFSNRIQLAVAQTGDYFEKGDASTSIGLRLELWRAAWIAGRENPLLGIGFSQKNSFIEQKILIGALKPDIANRRHPHSDYLLALQSRGFPGLALVLLLYAVPMMIFFRGLLSGRPELLFASLSGSLFTLAYATFSLTEVPPYNGLPLVFFIVVVSLCIGLVKHQQVVIDADSSA